MYTVENILKMILENSTDHMVLLDPSCKVICFNQEMKNTVSRFSSSELKEGDDYRGFVFGLSADSFSDLFNKALNGESVSCEQEAVARHFSIWFRYKFSPILDSNKQTLGVSVVAVNINDCKRMQLENKKVIAELNERNNALEQFAHIVSHGIRSPLASMLGLSNLLENDLEPAERAYCLAGIKKSAEILNAMTVDLNAVLQVKKEVILEEVQEICSELILEAEVTDSSNFQEALKNVFIRICAPINFQNHIPTRMKLVRKEIIYKMRVWSGKRDDWIIRSYSSNGTLVDLVRHSCQLLGELSVWMFRDRQLERYTGSVFRQVLD